MESALVSVAVPLPFQAPFTYRMPPGSPVPDRGVRVLVPFAHRRVIGVVTGGAAAGTEGLKDVLEVVDEAPLVAPPPLDPAARGGGRGPRSSVRSERGRSGCPLWAAGWAWRRPPVSPGCGATASSRWTRISACPASARRAWRYSSAPMRTPRAAPR